VDSTWGAGLIENGSFRRRFCPYWFLTAPIDFVETHLPKNPADQRLRPLMSMQTFMRRPYTTPVFYEHNMRVLPPNDSDLLQVDNGEVTIDIALPSGDFLALLQVCSHRFLPSPRHCRRLTGYLLFFFFFFLFLTAHRFW